MNSTLTLGIGQHNHTPTIKVQLTNPEIRQAKRLYIQLPGTNNTIILEEMCTPKGVYAMKISGTNNLKISPFTEHTILLQLADMENNNV